MLKNFLLTVLALLVLDTSTNAAFTAKFFNNCPEAVDVQFTIHGRDCGRQMVQPGGVVDHPCEPPACAAVQPGVFDDCGGASLLLHKDGRILAAEYGRRDDGAGTMVLWYNWSSDDGNPFLGVGRRMIVGGPCPHIICEPGSDDCDWKKKGIDNCKPDPNYVEVHVC